MREMFTQEEMRERLRFTQLFNDHFRLRKGFTKDFRHPFTVDLLYRIYQRMYPEAHLSAADFELYFNIIGAISTSGSIYLDLRAQDVNEIHPALWKCIETIVTPEKYGLLTAQSTLRKTVDPAENYTLQFFDLFVRRRNKKIKTSIQQLFSLYSLYCIQNNFPLLGNKRFIGMINKHINPVKKGYADGKSGINYVFCEIPAEISWPVSLQLGLGVFNFLEKYFDNTGKVLKFTSEGVPDQITQAHITYRLAGKINESQTETKGSTEQKQEDSPDVNGRENESIIPYVGGGETESDTEASDNADEGSYSGTEECEYTDGTTTQVAGSEFTDDDFNEDAEDDSRDAEYEGSDDEPDYNNQEKPTLKEVFTALEIAYKINPGTFNKRAMNSYLVSMDVDYGAEDIWDKFMQFVGGEL